MDHSPKTDGRAAKLRTSWPRPGRGFAALRLALGRAAEEGHAGGQGGGGLISVAPKKRGHGYGEMRGNDGKLP